MPTLTTLNYLAGVNVPLSITQLWEQPVRATLSGTERLSITGSGRLKISNDAEQGSSDITYDPVVLGNPAASRVSFVVPDGWQLPIIDRLKLVGTGRASVKGHGRIYITDFGPRARLVLQGSSAGR